MRFQRVQAVRKAAATHPAPDVEPAARGLPEGSVKVRHLGRPVLFLNHSTAFRLSGLT